MSESDRELKAEKNTEFFTILKDYKIVLSKSNLPEIKSKKSKAISTIKDRLETEFGITYTEAQIWKKLNNLKARIKRKSHLIRTGNRQNFLKPWEEDFMEFLESAKDPNVPFIPMPEASTPANVLCEPHVGYFYENDGYEEEDDADVHDESTMGSLIKQEKNMLPSSSRGPMGTGHMNVDLKEADDTKHLSLHQLQRIVLLQQLRYYKKAEKLVDIQLEEKNKATQE